MPTDSLLRAAIGETFSHVEHIRAFVKEKYGATTEEWKFYGQKYGWQLKTFLKKRNLFFIIPLESSFKIVFIFGDRAVEAIEKSDVSEALISEVVGAKKYAEGRGLSIDIKDQKALKDVEILIDIKINN